MSRYIYSEHGELVDIYIQYSRKSNHINSESFEILVTPQVCIPKHTNVPHATSFIEAFRPRSWEINV